MEQSMNSDSLNALCGKLAEAEAMARKAHDGHEDRVGAPYFQHAEAVSEYAGQWVRNRHMHPEDFEIKARIVGFLHDVVEDTSTTFAELEALDLPEDCLHSVRLLTRNREQPYMEYLAQVKQDPLTRMVKLADLVHNSELARYIRADREITPEDMVRLEKYTNGIEYLLR